MLDAYGASRTLKAIDREGFGMVDDADGSTWRGLGSHPLARALSIASVPVLALGGLVAIGRMDLTGPTYLGVGVLLFVVMWGWFRMLGRLVF